MGRRDRPRTPNSFRARAENGEEFVIEVRHDENGNRTLRLGRRFVRRIGKGIYEIDGYPRIRLSSDDPYAP
jgi:hypothetical protein